MEQQEELSQNYLLILLFNKSSALLCNKQELAGNISFYFAMKIRLGISKGVTHMSAII